MGLLRAAGFTFFGLGGFLFGPGLELGCTRSIAMRILDLRNLLNRCDASTYDYQVYPKPHPKKSLVDFLSPQIMLLPVVSFDTILNG